MSRIISLALVVVSCVLVAAGPKAGGSLPACTTPGRVEATVCPSRLCGPHGFCIAVQFGGPCSCDADCTSQHCNSQTNTCDKSPVGGRCWANADCSSNNCDTLCNRCAAVNAGSKCSCNSDCTTNNCDETTHTCLQNGRAGDCAIPGDCLSGDCDVTGHCARSQPEFACTCDSDCVPLSKCLRPTLADGSKAEVGECFASARSACDTDSECGTGFCTSSLESNSAVCTPGGVGAPCAADCDCADGGTNTLYCHPSAVAETRGVCAENLCALQVCDVHATCTNAGPTRYKCVCNAGYEGLGFNTGDARTPGCVGIAGSPRIPPPPPPVPVPEPIVQGLLAFGSPCVQNFECGSQNCVGGTCLVTTTGHCQGDVDCGPGQWCVMAAFDSFQIGNPPSPLLLSGVCEVNRCATDNGGCATNAVCTPEARNGRKCKCDEAHGYFGSGKAKDGLRACVNPCTLNNGGCGPASRAECVALNRDDVRCVCLAGFYNNDNNNEKECIDPCLQDNGGCNKFEICHAHGPERDTDVACRCRDGFLQVGDKCVINYCHNQCTGADQVCVVHDDDRHDDEHRDDRRGDHDHDRRGGRRGDRDESNFHCECTQPGFEYYQGTCIQNFCKADSPVCASAASCRFFPAGNIVGSVTGNSAIDQFTTCTCDFGYQGNGFVATLGTGNGCTAVSCPAADVSRIAHAVAGNCDGSQQTKDYCVLGCEDGWKPSVDPKARCVGQTQTTSLIEFRDFECKRERRHDDDQAWTCTGAECRPRAPTVGWKHDGRIGLRWAALGPSVARLTINWQLSSGGQIWSEDVTPMPAYATTREITGLTPGAQYAFWLVVHANEGSGPGSDFTGDKLFTRV